MANIAVNNYCNLACPYCFANEFIAEEDKSSITIEQLKYILEYLSRSPIGRVGLIGGEPTIHPNIREILKVTTEFCEQFNTRWTMFSNGINLGEVVDCFNSNVASCLINVNHPDILGNERWARLKRSLDRFKLRNNLSKLSIGINLYPDMIDYQYIFALAEEYGFTSIRTSYVAPTCQFQGSNKDKYYTDAKDLFLRYVADAKAHGLEVRLDCNHIPYCYFTDEEKAFMSDVVSGFHNYCNPVVDITPEFKATACFGSYELVDLEGFENMLEVERYLCLKKMTPLAEANNGGKCATCPKHENMSCQGGCLAFAKYNK